MADPTTQQTAQPSTLWAKLGPGVLFAGAAIGTSHLVQSTRAGALYGLGFLGIILFANFIRYPSFRFGPAYAAATGESLIDAYARHGKWVIPVVSVAGLLIHAIIIAATAITSAGIAVSLLGLNVDARYFGVGLLALGALVVRLGGYRVLDNVTKVFVATLTLCTLAATVLVVPEVKWEFTVEPFYTLSLTGDLSVFLFAVAVMGFMPAGIDLAILHSLWATEKSRLDNTVPQDSLTDFNISYVGTIVLAVCFLIMGAGIMHSGAVQPATSAPAFADQVVGLYTQTLGAWSGLVVGTCALAVMFTTLLALVDGAPRMQAACAAVWFQSDSTQALSQHTQTIATVVICSASAVILIFAMSSFTVFIDFVTTTTFVVGPAIAWLNHQAMTNTTVPAHLRPSQGMQAWSWLGIIAMTIITLIFFYTRLTA